jgi:hypothetical protein
MGSVAPVRAFSDIVAPASRTESQTHSTSGLSSIWTGGHDRVGTNLVDMVSLTLYPSMYARDLDDDRATSRDHLDPSAYRSFPHVPTPIEGAWSRGRREVHEGGGRGTRSEMTSLANDKKKR